MQSSINQITIFPIPNIPLIKPGDDLAAIIVNKLKDCGYPLKDKDIVVIAQKIVSKAEGRVVSLAEIPPSPKATKIAKIIQMDPHLVEVILRESREVLAMAKEILIVEQKEGFICARAGVDRSNVPQEEGKEMVSLLPLDADRSAAELRERIFELTGKEVGIIINDTQGRPFREGVVGVAIGISGIKPLVNKRGLKDLFGYKLRYTLLALADEVAASASMVMGQTSEGRPVVIIRGVPYEMAEGSAKELIRHKEKDLFRPEPISL